MLGIVGHHVGMGQIRGRCTASEGVLEGLQGSVGGYRVSLGSCWETLGGILGL